MENIRLNFKLEKSPKRDRIKKRIANETHAQNPENVVTRENQELNLFFIYL